MKEESQLDDMRAAIRGDRIRAEERRRRSLENVLAATEPPPPADAPAAPPADAPAAPPPAAAEPSRQSLLRRLIGR